MKKEAGKLQRVENAIKRMKQVEVIVMGAVRWGSGRIPEEEAETFKLRRSFMALVAPSWLCLSLPSAQHVLSTYF